MAILKQVKHPAAVKLFVNWALHESKQRSINDGWTVRTDLAPTGGLDQVWNVPQANLDEFTTFMSDRANVERWKQTFTLYFGEVQGRPTPGSHLRESMRTRFLHCLTKAIIQQTTSATKALRLGFDTLY